MTDFFLRCKQSDHDAMINYAIALGLVQKVVDENGAARVIGSGWTYVNGDGKVYKGTGVFKTIEGVPVEQQAPVVDEDGIPYCHVNIRTEVDLKARAIELGLTAELQELGRFFVVDDEGKPKRPSQPALVYF